MRFLKRVFQVLVILIGILFLVYWFGPQVDKPNLDTTLPAVSSNLMELQKQIDTREAAMGNIKPDNQARIVWYDSIPAKTPYSIVYLHGWSASQGEGSPLHMETAQKYGCNLYLPRLAGHGLEETEPMLDLTADALITSAKEAIAVGKQLGEKVILMSTSTGCTLALHLAQEDKDIAGILLYSPNIAIFDPNASLLSKPWGLQLARMVKGGDYHISESTEEEKKYWTSKYRVEALTHLQVLVDETMKPETFEKIDQPIFMGYFFKNDSIQDKVVSVPAMLEMYDQLGTPKALKRKVAFPEVGNHVIASYMTSKDLESVRKETYAFLEEILDLKPKPPMMEKDSIPSHPEKEPVESL
ncbi:MAG: alpha/beta hydrolase [Bacteroidota bacterium]